MRTISDFLRKLIWNLLLFFNHSSVKFGGHPPADVAGKIVVSLHRNGMLDLFLTRYLWPEVVALTSVQWHQNFFTRWLIGGVGVTRSKDRAKKIQAENHEALERCADLLKKGQAVGIAPEGSSQLGPGHLPFQKAAARVAAKMLENQAEVKVVPVSPVYLKAWAWRSPVELYVGPELTFRVGLNMNEIHREISRALTGISLKAQDLESLMAGQAAAWEAVQLPENKGASFSGLLLASPEQVLGQAILAYRQRHLQIPENDTFYGALVWDKNPARPGAALTNRLIHRALALLSASARLIVWPAHRLSRSLRKKLVDDLNVVALWRGLVAMPLIALWLLILGVGAALICSPLWALFIWGLSIGALVLEPLRRRYRALVKSAGHLGQGGSADYRQELQSIWLQNQTAKK